MSSAIIISISAVAAVASGLATARADAPAAPTRSWNFDADRSGVAPSGFSFGRTGGGAQGNWIVKAEPDAPSSPNVLAQVDTDTTDYRFPVAVADEPTLKNFRLSVKCKPVSGKVDQACGLVFRYRDANNYYITRANALEDDVRIYRVKGGLRVQFASWKGKVAAAAWHELRVEGQGDHFQVSWDGKKVIDAYDGTFSEAGRVGVWTKADSVTYFDDLSVMGLP